MKLAVDMHIHSVLSPCGDKDMTPNNIVNMSLIKGLDVISVTDHNTMGNLKSVWEIGKEKGILVVPGIEVTTREEVHVLCYFSDLNNGLQFSKIIYDSLPMIKNKPKVFGEQRILDINDNYVGELDKLLLNSTPFSIKDIYKLSKEYNGIIVPAHVDKSTFSILSTLGFIPEDINISALELSKKYDTNKKNYRVDFDKYTIVRNSDAHYLKDINEREFYLYPKSKTIKAILAELSKTEDY
ncbi:PHP domain-containing protein [Sporosalibacterium faouarense]|uniref:PHP domain-containing protein n=1 Tax=Sporosalibacterium faouarense TaxID=516123 RepID=UPI00141CB812|nr:PHP domain-containing protein [Sporosalibacterium faouarense]MTI48555.1 phosphoesterase [Bacillota bacterium]